MNKSIKQRIIQQLFMMIAILFIGNRVFNHFDAWVGIAVCLCACYPVINIVKSIKK